MKQAVGIVVVFVVSILNVYVAVPLGSVFDLGLELTLLVALAGSVGGTVAMVFVGEWIWPRIRAAINRVRGRKDVPAPKKSDAESGRVARIVDRFGVVGLGLIAPFTVGGFAGAIAGVALELPKGKLALWLGLGQAIFVVLYSLFIDVSVGID